MPRGDIKERIEAALIWRSLFAPFLFLLLHHTTLFDFLNIDNTRAANDHLPTGEVGRILTPCLPNHQVEQMAALDALTHRLAIF